MTKTGKTIWCVAVLASILSAILFTVIGKNVMMTVLILMLANVLLNSPKYPWYDGNGFEV